jgi:uncharacterized membrane protein YoaK (UPF0700 family)
MRQSVLEEYFGSPEKAEKNKKWLRLAVAAALAVVAGYADVVCFVRYNAFATAMDGNLLLAAKAYVKEGFKVSPDVGMPLVHFYLLIVVLRMLGFAAHNLAEHLHPRGSTMLTPLLIISVLGVEIANFCTTYELYPGRWDVLMLAPVFGVQAGISTEGMVGAPTSLATMHMQAFTKVITEYIFKREGQLTIPKQGLQFAVPLGLCAGALMGTLAEDYSKGKKGEELLLSPIVCLLAVCVAIDDHFTTPTLATRQREALEEGQP